MKNVTISIILMIMTSVVWGQSQNSETKSWSLETELNLYLIPNDFFALPIIRADKDQWHIEGRYNYEDLRTFSGWAGYNFSGGQNWEYKITPMIGGVVGLSNGIAPGLEVTLTHKRFELYSESEYLFDFGVNENSFYYNWIDLTYSPNDWMWFGLSGQRTRLYKTNLDIQRGVMLGFGRGSWEVTGYLYNLGFDTAFGLITLSAHF